MNKQYKCFWGSSYDRGLERLLAIWPDIKKEVPLAELHIYYGWQLFDAVYSRMAYNPERMAWKETVNKKMQQPGVFHHGRVGQKQLLQEMKNYGIWAYPTNFDEISCITAMNCQILGLIPITNNVAALKETVKYGTKVEGDIADPEVLETYKNELISWLKSDTKQKAIRKEMCEWATKEFSWSKVAKEWSEEFKTPKVYSDAWAKELFESLPKELQNEEFRGYRL
jgi:glycosyltransferase involved in cell wall biosynthesis